MKRTPNYLIVLYASVLFFAACSGGGNESQKTTSDIPKPKEVELSPLEIKMAEGKKVYDKTCLACHQANGNGVEGAFPPLASSDFFAGDKLKLVSNIVNGIKGEITVNGKKYNTEMPKQPVTDEEAASVATYVLNSFGNGGGDVTVAEVLSVKK